MERGCSLYNTYVDILKRELVCAQGCTEPIAIAYCAAVARSVLGQLPERVEIEASGNIIKNVKSVVVPGTNGGRGIAVAAAIGILGGDETALLEVIKTVPQQARDRLPAYLGSTPITLIPVERGVVLDIGVNVYKAGSYAKVRIANEHTNIVLMEKDGEILLEKPTDPETPSDDAPDYGLLSVENIYDFASTCDLDDVRETLTRQIEMNYAISEEGLRGNWGANIGSTLLHYEGKDVRTRAKARAAAGSDARMSGCELPVVINSGSGNQGMTASLPVIEYARDMGSSEDILLRALLISNLIATHAKTSIGRLSAYCGAVSAGAAAGAGVAFLHGGGVDEIAHTLVNALAITSGIVCDGAKASCAAKIAMAVEAGFLGREMYCQGHQFYGGDGIVKSGVENSIRSFGRLGRQGMRQTDEEIIKMMTEE
ncbi:MAG: serine dehydratase subunit alpha family protein [Oscillibacter sp.]|nr:serine dehydratase subunit alpha family protein [Oscillibacter sp.]